MSGEDAALFRATGSSRELKGQENVRSWWEWNCYPGANYGTHVDRNSTVPMTSNQRTAKWSVN
jgi:hypothetical protein